jgi:hypothetical protein
MKNFHLPLPEGTYAELRTEAERVQQPDTTVVREAVVFWLRARKKVERQNAIAAYAAKMAGTPFDLDKSLESAAIEQLTKLDPDTRWGGVTFTGPT